MKRPTAVVGLTYVFAAGVAVCFSWEVCFYVAAVLGVLTLFAGVSKHPNRHKVMLILLTGSIACAAVSLSTLWYIQPQRALAGQTLVQTGKVSRINGARSIEIKQKGGLSLAVSAREALDVSIGDVFTAEVKLELYERGSNSQYAEGKAKITPLRGFVVGEYSVAPAPSGSLQGTLNSIKRSMSQSLRGRLPLYHGNVLAAMLLGEKHLLSKDINDNFAAGGISHILAISGFHLAVIAGFLERILAAFRPLKRAVPIFTAGGVLFYMAIVGFSPSVVRAGVMIIIALCGRVIWRRADALTSLAVAGLFICGANPLAAADISFQLSFLATLGIVLCAKPFETFLSTKLGELRYPRVKSALASAVSVTLCATAFTMPVTISAFGQVALYAPLTNLLILPLLPVVMLSGFAAMVIGAVPYISFFAAPLAFVAGISTTALVGVAEIIAGLPFARLPVGAGFISVWLVGAAVMVGVACMHPTRRKTEVCALLCAITLFIGVGSYQIAVNGAVIVTTVTTGSGIAQVAVKDRHAVIAGNINSKSDVYTVQEVLKRYSIDYIELLAITPTKGRRSSAVSTFFTQYTVKMAVVDFAELPDAKIKEALTGVDELYTWGDINVKLLGDGSFIIMDDTICLEFSGIKNFILTQKCDIIASVGRLGACDIATITGGAPKNIESLRCKLMIVNEAYGGGYAESITVLNEETPEAGYIIKNSNVKIVD